MVKMAKNKKGLTLIEIMIVVAIIVILTAVVGISAAKYIQAGESVSSDVASQQESFSSAKNEINQDYIDIGY